MADILLLVIPILLVNIFLFFLYFIKKSQTAAKAKKEDKVSPTPTSPPISSYSPTKSKLWSVIKSILSLAILLAILYFAFQFLYPWISQDSRVSELKAAWSGDRGVEFYDGDCYPFGNAWTYKISRRFNDGGLTATCYLKKTINGSYPWAEIVLVDFEGFVSTKIIPLNPKDGCEEVFGDVAINTGPGGVKYRIDNIGHPILTITGYNRKTGKYKEERRGIVKSPTCDRSAPRIVEMTILVNNLTRQNLVTNFSAGGTVTLK